MPRRTPPNKPLETVAGDFAPLSSSRYMLTTEHGMYFAQVVYLSGLSSTEKRGVNITTADGTDVMSFDFIRVHLKTSVRVNVSGYGRFGSEVECVEAMTRHFVARFEQRQVKAVAA